MSITLNDSGPAHEAGNINSGGAGFGGSVPHNAGNPNPGGADSGGGPEPGGDGIRGSAPIFAALGDKTRLALVARMCSGGPLSIARLTAGADITRQAITKHLNILAGAGL